jgi:hypothetical protein
MRWIDKYYLDLYRHSTNDLTRVNICRAAITHLSSYLGWLRARETFSVTWGDVTMIPPMYGPVWGLPEHMGAVLLKLLPQTKSSQTATADVVLAYTTASGLSLGSWIMRLRPFLTPGELRPEAFVLAHPNGNSWSSHYYRYTYFYPALAILRSLGDPYLSKYDESAGMGLTDAFWSFNTQRRTGRSQVSKKRPTTIRKATPAEVIEHGRWRISRASMDMPTAYLEWGLADRICISFFCM